MRKTKGPLKTFILTSIFILAILPSGWAASAPEDLQLKAYLALVKADGARDRDNAVLATDQYRRSIHLYENLQKEAPSYKSQIVTYRIRYCANQIKALAPKVNARPLAPSPSSEASQKAQLQGLMTENQTLKRQLEKLSAQTSDEEESRKIFSALQAAQKRNRILESQIASFQEADPNPALPVSRKNPLEDLAAYKQKALAQQDSLLREIELHKVTSINLLKRAEEAEIQLGSVNASQQEYDALLNQTRAQIEDRDLAIAGLEGQLAQLNRQYDNDTEQQNLMTQKLVERDQAILTLQDQITAQRDHANAIQNELVTIQSEVANQQPIVDLSEEVERLNQALSTLRKKQAERAKQGGSRAARQYSQRSTDDLLTRKQTEVNEAMKRLARAEAAIRALSKEAAEGRKAARAYQAMASMEKELRATKKALANMARQQNQPKAKILALEETVEALSSRIEAQTRDLRDAVSTRDILQAQREDLLKQLNESQLALASTRMQFAQAEVKGSTAEMSPEILAQITELEALVDQQKVALLEAEAEQKEFGTQQQSLEEEILAAEADKERLSKLLLKAAQKAAKGERELGQQIAALGKRLADQSQQIEMSGAERDELVKAKAALEIEMAQVRKELMGAQKALKAETNRLAEVEEALARLEQSKGDVGRLEKELSVLRKTQQTAESALNEQADDLNKAIEQIKDYEKQLTEVSAGSVDSKKALDDLKVTRERSEELQASYENIAAALREAEREAGALETALARAQEENIRLKDSLSTQGSPFVLGEGRAISELEKVDGAENTESLESEVARLQAENESGRASLEVAIAKHDAQIALLTEETASKRLALEKAVSKIQEYQDYATSLKSSNQRKIKALVKKIEELSKSSQ